MSETKVTWGFVHENDTHPFKHDLTQHAVPGGGFVHTEK